MLRRSILSTTGLAVVGTAVAACSMLTPSAPGTIPAQILEDTTGALNALAQILPSLTASTPPVLTKAQEAPLLADINLALSFIATIGPGTPAQTGATMLARVEGYFNAALTGLSGVPLPANGSLIVIAANVVAASLEAYVNSLIPPTVVPVVPTPAAARAKALAPGMSIEKARAILGVK